MAEKKNKWLVKKEDGQIIGPFTTEQVLLSIRHGHFLGGESVALFPGTDWRPISTEAEFYDHLLGALMGKEPTAEEEEIHSDQELVEDFAQPSDVPSSKAKQSDSVKRGKAERVDSGGKEQKQKQEEPNKKDTDPVLELKKTRKIIKKKRRQKAFLPIVLLATVLGLVSYILVKSVGPTSGGVRLVAPSKNQTQKVTPEELERHLQRGQNSFLQDTLSGYLSAQNYLVQGIEGGSLAEDPYALLCMTHFELWPYTHQTSEDLAAIRQTKTQVAARFPGSVGAAACNVVLSLVEGQPIRAKDIVDGVLESFAEGGEPPILFYYLKAQTLSLDKNFESAASYAVSAQQLWPRWMKVYVFEADMYLNQGQMERAAQRYRQVIEAHPNHAWAMINLGHIEFYHFKNAETAKVQINQALSLDDPPPPKILARGYQTLADMALSTGQSSQAFDFAKKAYEIDPGNTEARKIMVQLKGQESVDKANVRDQQLVYEGDQFVREGDCTSAQAYYKAAYEVNPKNAMAAYKAAKCLWEQSLSSEAIRWVNLALRADPEFVLAYTLLADYYTQRFDYNSAARVLTKARQKLPGNYQVMRGIALFDFRRQNYQGAVQSAEQALKLYETDVPSHIILSKAHLKLQNYQEAYSHGAQAVELDPNNHEAQVTYAKSLAGINGAQAGIEYFNNLVTNYPVEVEYRLGLAELLIEQERYAEAEQIYRQAISLNDKPKKAHLGLGKVYERQGLYDKSLDAFLKAAVYDPADVEPIFLAGNVYLSLGKANEAITQFKRVLAVNDKYPRAHYFMGESALLKNDTETALEEAMKERALNPGLVDSYLLAAEVYRRQRQYNLCAQEYQKAQKITELDSNLYVKLAHCYRLAGNLDLAEAMLNQAELKESGNPAIYRELGALFEMKGEGVRAAAAYRQYLVLNPTAPDKALIENKINNF